MKPTDAQRRLLQRLANGDILQGSTGSGFRLVPSGVRVNKHTVAAAFRRDWIVRHGLRWMCQYDITPAGHEAPGDE